ncbi:isopeptide-forming domain-containing fimbrial protein [Enterococcus crotali]|uniref:isopeptide-forming domain-containing fimbrial protein n=1 Tax=Enterococcus crotali TaxID=1453587 RepID=UPI0004702135|nr:isopeptide-forming domain-containing fimbrial protein [Enterococcus crotali]
MKIGKKSIVVVLLVSLFSILGFLVFSNQTKIQASENNKGQYTLEKISESTDQIEFLLKVKNPQKEEIVLSLDGNETGLLSEEALIENLPSKQLNELEVKEHDQMNKVTIQFKEATGEYEFPMIFNARTTGKDISDTLKVVHKNAVVAKASFDLKYPEEAVESKKNNTETASTVAYSARNLVTVEDWDSFVSALQNPTVSSIQLTKNISRGSSSVNPGTVSRSVTIDGANGVDNFSLDFGANSAANFRINLGAVGIASEIRFNNVNLKGSGTAVSSNDAIVYASAADSANWTAAFNNISLSEGHTKRIAYLPNGAILMDGGNIHLTHNGIGSGGAGGTSMNNNWHKLFEAKNITITNGTKISGTFSDMFMGSQVNDATILVNQGSTLDLNNSRTTMIAIDGDRATMKFDGEGTKATLYSSQTGTDRFGGILCIQGVNSLIEVTNSAHFYLDSQSHPATILQGNGSIFNIKNKAVLNAKIRNDATGNGFGAVMRFRTSSDMQFNIENNSEFSIIKEASSSSETLRLSGGNNAVKVTGGSKFKIIGNGNQEAINYTGTGNSFKLEDKNSKVEIISTLGRGFSSGNQTIIAGDPGTEFTIDGYGTGGTFSFGTNSILEFHNMLYYDFRNNSGSVVFNGSGDLKNVYSDVSVWKQGNAAQLEGNPYSAWTLIDMGLYDTGFRYDYHSSRAARYRTFQMSQINLPGTFTTDDSVHAVLGSTANNMRTMARISGNNANPVVDELRTPTNADKYAFGHVTIPEGVEGSRSAWTDEVTVVLKVTKANTGETYEINGKTVGADEQSQGLNVYGEGARPGLFQAENKRTANGATEFFETGDKVEVLRAWRGGKDGDLNPDPNTVHLGKPGDEVPGDLKGWADSVATIDVTPPTQAVVTTDLSNATKQLSGTSDENGAKVFFKVNGAWLKGTDGQTISTIVNAGKWEIDLPEYLTKTDKVDVYLKDTTLISPLPSYTLPDTYTQEPDGVFGNINTEVDSYSTYAGYHDAIKAGTKDDRFNQAKRLIVKDVIPDQSTLVKSVESSGGSDKTAIGDTLTYTLKAENPKAGSEAWKNVELVDVLAEGLDFDPADHGITINGKSIGEDQSKFSYVEATRTLKIYVGDLAANTNATATFKVKLGQSAVVGSDVKNRAKANGDSPQEKPFVQGPINPDSAHAILTVNSNEVGLPGGKAEGVLSFISAPKMIDFGLKESGSYGNFSADDPEYDQSLVVSDSREVLTDWKLSAKVTKVMESTADHSYKLPEALVYKEGSRDNVLKLEEPYDIIKKARGSQNVSEEEWVKKGNGFKMVLEANQYRKLGEYTATVKFTLSETQ